MADYAMEHKPLDRQAFARSRSVIGNDQFVAGSFFVVSGAIALWVARDYPAGSANQMLSGYFPRVISGLLVLLGVLIACRGMGRQARTEKVMPSCEWRSALCVPLALVAFAETIETLGLIPAVFLTVIVLAFSEKKKRWGEALAMGAVLSVLSYLVFVVFLGFSVPALPRF